MTTPHTPDSKALEPCPWCGALGKEQDEWGYLVTHKPTCYWLNLHGDPIGRVRVNFSEVKQWNMRSRASVAAVDEDAPTLLDRIEKLELDPNFSSHYLYGFELCREQVKNIIKEHPAVSSSLPAEPPTRSDLHAVICSVVFRHCKDVQLPHGIRGLEDDLTAALTKHFTSTDALDEAIKEAEDDLRITCPEMFGGKPISYKRGSE